MPSIADRATLAQEIGRVADQYRRTFPERQVRVWARDNDDWSTVYSSHDGVDSGPWPGSASRSRR